MRKISVLLITALLLLLSACQGGIEADTAVPTLTAEPTEVAQTESSSETQPIPQVSESTEPTAPEVHTHSYTETIVKPTCTEDGYTLYTCECGDSYKEDYVNLTRHTWGSWETVTEATETKEGLEKRTCSVCSQSESRSTAKIIPNHTHKYVETITTKATCKSDGVKTFACSCGHTYTESIAKTAHQYRDTVTAPTCTENGYTTHTCKVCSYSYQDTYVMAAGHKYSAKTVSPTCTDGGYTLYACSCGDSYKGQFTSATGHSWSGWNVTKEPSTTATGTKERSCGKCGIKETASIEKLTVTEPEPTTPAPTTPKPTDPPHTHNYTVTDQKDADCENDGYITKTCSCGDVQTTTIIAKGHSWVHHDEVGHNNVYIECSCKWRCLYNYDDPESSYVQYDAHLASLPISERFNHSYHTTREWVVDTAAYDQCSVCQKIK